MPVSSGFYPYTRWVQLAPSEKKTFDKVAYQNSPFPIFTGQTSPLTIKTSPLFFTFFLFFSICTLNKTFSPEEEEAQNKGKNSSQKWPEGGEPSLMFKPFNLRFLKSEPCITRLGWTQNREKSCARFRFKIWTPLPMGSHIFYAEPSEADWHNDEISLSQLRRS